MAAKTAAPRALRLLVVDAYPAEGRRRLADAGGTEAGCLYRRLLEGLAPEATIEIVHPADGEKPRRALGDYGGAVWTGSNLSILDVDDPGVRACLALARDLRRDRVPCFGSCFAVQVAAVAAGGRCAASPRGREFGVAHRIELSPAGRVHPLYAGKPARFDAFTSHADEVVVLAPGQALLASNAWSRVQGAAVEDRGWSFWAVQYHPEYDCHEVASLCRLRSPELVAQGTFESAGAAERWVRDLERLHEDPSAREGAARLGIDDGLLDPTLRTLEVRNWLERRVR